MSEEKIGSGDVRDPQWEARYERTAFVVMLVLFAAMPLLIYPRFATSCCASRSSPARSTC
jgi:hypothetical protein